MHIPTWHKESWFNSYEIWDIPCPCIERNSSFKRCWLIIFQALNHLFSWCVINNATYNTISLLRYSFPDQYNEQKVNSFYTYSIFFTSWLRSRPSPLLSQGLFILQLHHSCVNSSLWICIWKQMGTISLRRVMKPAWWNVLWRIKKKFRRDRLWGLNLPERGLMPSPAWISTQCLNRFAF